MKDEFKTIWLPLQNKKIKSGTIEFIGFYNKNKGIF